MAKTPAMPLVSPDSIGALIYRFVPDLAEQVFDPDAQEAAYRRVPGFVTGLRQYGDASYNDIGYAWYPGDFAGHAVEDYSFAESVRRLREGGGSPYDMGTYVVAFLTGLAAEEAGARELLFREEQPRVAGPQGEQQ